MIKESTKRTESSMNMNLITTSEYMKKKLTKLNQEIDHLNRSIARRETDSAVIIIL